MGDEEEHKKPEPRLLVCQTAKPRSASKDKALIEQLAKRISHLKSSIALEKRKTKSVIEPMTERKPPVNQVPSKSQIKLPRQKNDTVGARIACDRWQVAIGLVMGMAKMATRSMQVETEPFSVGDLVFDPSLFKANKNYVVLTDDSKFVLSQLPEKRSEQQIEELTKNLKEIGIKSFNEYPADVQRKLVRIARYEVVTPQRVIIRQGRPSENLYFLIDGTVVAIERIRGANDEYESEDLLILRKGAMFGETEMINRLNRRATVISKANVELLTLERSDLLKVYSNYEHPTESQDHIKFLQHCDFIDLWPINKLVNDLDICTPYFFKQNALIIEDGSKTDFLVVVRSGQCRVIRKLYKNVSKNVPKVDGQTKSNKVKMLEYNDELLRNNFRHFSRHGSQFDSVFRADSFEQKLRVNANVEQIIDQIRPQPSQTLKTRPSLQSHCSQSYGEMSKSTLTRHGSKRLERGNSFRKQKSIRTLNNRIEQDVENELAILEYSQKTKLEKALLLPKTQEYLLKENETDNENENEAVYIQIDILKKKDVFGLDTLVFDKYYDHPDATGLCLVSGENEKGVDVVFLSKTFFVEHASEQVAWRVRRMMKSHPDAETLWAEIERQELWADYKEAVIDDIFMGKPILLKTAPWL
ncbi:unnamed protein product [Acanthosepion pharaonis]|uniref:Cyclic nucleotide-binding domain-containing protein n=1 Tax=Acanthosepion pharaonis TaxID=158019 RepID=A0A812CFI1_ACAPH|nr:unnamed protein product [Sepia pharaonis]